VGQARRGPRRRGRGRGPTCRWHRGIGSADDAQRRFREPRPAVTVPGDDRLRARCAA
jgi:hypothetical protein